MRPLEVFRYRVRYDHCRGRISIASGFGDDHDVGIYSIVLDVEPFTAPAKSCLSLVDDKQGTEFVHRSMQFLQVLLWRENHSSRRENRFDNDGSHILLLRRQEL